MLIKNFNAIFAKYTTQKQTLDFTNTKITNL